MQTRAFVSLSVVTIVLAGCGAPKEEPGPAETGGKKFVVGMSQCNLGEPWRQQMNKDIAEAAKAYPELQVIFKDAQNKSEVQQQHVKEFMQQGVDAIIISPKETEPLTAPVAEAYQAGIPVIVLDRAVKGDEFTMFIGADNVKIGRAAGQFLAKALGGKGVVVELKGLMTSEPGKDRNKGFLEGIRGSQLKVVFDPDCGWQETRAMAEMNSALARFEKIDAVYGHNDPSAHGAYMAAKQKGREKEMIFVGIDALPHEGINYVKQGILDATFLYPTGGKEAVDWVIRILRDKETPPKKIVLPTRIYTKDNVHSGGEEIP